MIKQFRIFQCFLTGGILFVQGCFNPVPPIKTITQAEQYFLKICREEFKLSPLTKMFNHTLWIYLPTEGPIVEYRGSKDGPKKSNAKNSGTSLLFLDGKFETETFYIEYAAGESTSYLMDPGVTSAYLEEFTQTQQHLLTAVFRAYADLETVPGDVQYLDAAQDEGHQRLVDAYIKKDSPPLFVVLVISDIKRGIEAETLFHFHDLKRTWTGEMPQEEYGRRSISELKGSVGIIGDKEGKYIVYKDIEWPEFLIKQILNRIRLGRQPNPQDSEPEKKPEPLPEPDTENEFVSIAAQTLNAYHFENFSYIKLHRLTDGKDFLFEKAQLKTYLK